LVISDPSDQRTQVITGNYPGGLWTDPIPGSYVRIRLITDVNVRQWGFAVDAKEAVAYPSKLRSSHPYHNNTDQTWTVLNDDPSPGQATRMHFSKVDLEENVDWLILSDIDDNPYQYITGSHPDGLWSIGVPGIAIKVRLVSDENVERWGFNVDQLQSTASNNPIPLPTLPAIVESSHPATASTGRLTIVNPDPAAISTKIHFSRINTNERWGYGCDEVAIYDAEDRKIQSWTCAVDMYDVWSDYVPGRIIKVEYVFGSTIPPWGFRVDRVEAGEARRTWAESSHPANTDETWTIVNPDPTAISTKVHFSRINTNERWGYGCDQVAIYDSADRLIQRWTCGVNAYDVWSDSVFGRIVKVKYFYRSTIPPWGFRIDGVQAGEARTIWAESSHPAEANETWTIVNPNPTASSTKVHFERINTNERWGYGCDEVAIYDANDNRIQNWACGLDLHDVWSEDVSGRLVKVKYFYRSTRPPWGFRIDDLFPSSATPITPAAINGIYVQVNDPGHIFVNDIEVAYAEEQGEYKIMLPGMGEHHIRIEYLEYTQNILVNVTEQGATIIYLPIVEKD
jgi:hypothetical protein